jgi:hypothetical protein
MQIRRTPRLAFCGLYLFMSLCLASPASRPQTRCGWFDNPTPGNASLHDRDGEWTIAMQGSYEADGDWPAFKDSQWVRVNGPHGYGCACITAVVNAKTRQVLSISSARARPLSACRKDPALKAPAGQAED